MHTVDTSLWETVIGLEIHVQLNTKTKMFGSEPYLFGSEPNTDIGVISTGQPGTLPVVNKEAVKKAIQFGLAVGAKIAPISRFDRKSYFYPDTPKNYQITQFDYPIVLGGSITADVNNIPKTFLIDRAHLEEDAGMLKHFTTFSGIDFNRAGVPLLEIVSAPCMTSPQEAVSYAMAIKAIMEYLDASDCNMEEGSFRMDANISVRLKGEKALRNKIEIKNMNSFSHMETALHSEILRQIQFYTATPDQEIQRGTYRFDPDKKEVILMRMKEQAEDYRYFPEADIPPITPSHEWISQIQQELPELPRERHFRYTHDLELPSQAVTLLVNEKKLSDYFEAARKTCLNNKSLANWLTIEFPGRLKELGKNLWTFGIKPEHITELVNMIEQGIINGKIAKSVADDMVKYPDILPSLIVKNNPDYQPIQNLNEIEALITQVIEENPEAITDYKAGKNKAFAFLIGQIMKLSRGKASPEMVNQILLKKLSP
ncbi:Asp-tRNA(Asn)/Glu-tRNA(Gln) amidotransferase subunit GatB [Rhabdochlamydiaceae symbiont of Dictyostelium giganteum]|uniref:Asp-tRNA(Asn)/Glu-tRNA(Gln) amidotransferase subunit GatB n=1 Tax=Rhabdochlamydiaceae symbiont of Dictyostelium giganteum TaxID=3342349 RepID=UPI00384CEF5F